jgi:hypothetical protein
MGLSVEIVNRLYYILISCFDLSRMLRVDLVGQSSLSLRLTRRRQWAVIS